MAPDNMVQGFVHLLAFGGDIYDPLVSQRFVYALVCYLILPSISVFAFPFVWLTGSVSVQICKYNTRRHVAGNRMDTKPLA